MPRFSVIIPTLNEEQDIAACLQRVRELQPAAEVIVSDGGSKDRTAEISRLAGALVVSGGRGRGTQCNVGASHAHGEIFLFLHADTILPPDAFICLETFFQRSEVKIGTFRLIFDDPHWLLALYSKFSRFDSILTRFGDQCIVVRKAFFESLSGFPNWPLFEDVRLLQMARLRTRIYSFPPPVTTSARRYLQNGVIRQQLRNLWVMVQYLFGVAPERLAQQYDHK